MKKQRTGTYLRSEISKGNINRNAPCWFCSNHVHENTVVYWRGNPGGILLHVQCARQLGMALIKDSGAQVCVITSRGVDLTGDLT